MDLLGSNLTTVRRTLLGGQTELTAAKVGWDGGREGPAAAAAAAGKAAAAPAAAAASVWLPSASLPSAHTCLSLSCPPHHLPQIIGCSMLKALEQVHAAGFIHRDVKPANFVMDPPGSMDPTAGELA